MESHESSPPSVSRDWFFPAPSPSFIHHSSASHRHLPNKPPTRRFSTYPRPPSTFTPSQLHTNPPSSPVTSAHHDLKYSRFRRRTNFSRHYQRSLTSEATVSSLADNIKSPEKCEVLEDKTVSEFAGVRLKFRWQMAFLVAVSSLYLFF